MAKWWLVKYGFQKLSVEYGFENCQLDMVLKI